MEARQVETFCLSLEGAVADRPFGPGLLTFKVGGKIFAILADEGTVSFKATEIAYELLREQGRARRAPYLPRGGWLNVEVAAWDADELSGLLQQSYKTIVAGLTRKTRHTLGLNP